MSGYITPKGTSYPAPRRLPPSRAAAASLWLAMSMLVADFLLTTIAGAVLSTSTSVSLAWIMVIIQSVVALALFSLALTFGILGLRDTHNGLAYGRGRAIAGIVIATVLLLLAAFWLPGEVIVAYLG